MLRTGLLPAGEQRVIEPAWRELMGRLRPFVARRVRGADVDDVLQDALLRMQRGLGGLREEARVTPWAYQVARSAIAEHRRSRARHPLASASDRAPGEVEELDPPAGDDPLFARLARDVAGLVHALPAPYREALTLTELGGLTQQEAARQLGITVSGMKSRVQRGRRLLRSALEERCWVALDARRRVIGCSPRPARTGASACCAARA